MGIQSLRKLIEKTDDKLSIFTNLEILNRYDFDEQELFKLIKDFLTDKEKVRLFACSHFQGYEGKIIECISDKDIKIKVLEKVLEKNTIHRDDNLRILKVLGVETLSEFLTYNKDNSNKINIKPYEIVNSLDSKKQLEFVKILENVNLTLSEKKEILVSLNDDVKQIITNGNFQEEYKTIVRIPTLYRHNKKEVLLDSKIDLEVYRGLDNLMRPILAENFTAEQRTTFMQICNICPNLQVLSSVNNEYAVSSTGAEYKEAEEWINSVLDNIDPSYSKAQKMAIIDNAIGKKISFSPDCGTEIFDKYDSRALWKIICSGYGVCNGIARVEQYMLERVGVQSEIIRSSNHAFLKIKDIELPLANGEIVKGTTLLDPTWNLASNKFGGKPDSFCVSYEEARKNDKDIDGIDRECHKNDEKLKDATLNLDEQSLRQLFRSVGLTNKDGQFPINDLIEKSNILHKFYSNQPEQDISKQFLLLAQTFPEFAKSPEETSTILKDILLSSENLKFDKCCINRVYDKKDKEKRPVLYVYIDFGDELGKKFYFVNKSNGQFIPLPQEEFVNQFDCYEEDLKLTKGFRPWETKEQVAKDLSKSSGKIIAEKGNQR